MRFCRFFAQCFVPVLMVLLTGCGDNEMPQEKNYFPLSTGMFWEYQVEETTYSPFGAPVSQNYQLRVVVTDSILSSEGDYIYIWHRYTRSSSSDSWQFHATWWARKYAGYALITEGNITYARLAFPAYINRSWNGNLFNAGEADTYRVSGRTDGITSPAGLVFNDVIEVEQENVINNLTYRDMRKEWYSHGIGLVRKESEVWSYRCGGGTCTGEIENGYAFRQILMDYGRD